MGINAGELEMTMSLRNKVSQTLGQITKELGEAAKKADETNKSLQGVNEQQKKASKGKKINIDVETRRAEKGVDTLYTKIDLLSSRFQKVASQGFDFPGIEKAKAKIDEIISKSLDPKNFVRDGKWNDVFISQIGNDMKGATSMVSELEKQISKAFTEERRAAREATREAKALAREREQAWNRHLNQINQVQAAMQRISSVERNLNTARMTNTNNDVRQAIDSRLAELQKIKEFIQSRLLDPTMGVGDKGKFLLGDGKSIFTLIGGRGGLLDEYDKFARQSSKVYNENEKSIQRLADAESKADAKMEASAQKLSNEYASSHEKIQRSIQHTEGKINDLKAVSQKGKLAGLDTSELDKIIARLVQVKDSMEYIQRMNLTKTEAKMYTGEAGRLSVEGSQATKDMTRAIQERNAKEKELLENEKARINQQKRDLANNEKLSSQYDRTTEKLTRQMQNLERVRDKVYRTIRDISAKGGDTTQLQELFNRMQAQIAEYKRLINNVSKAELVNGGYTSSMAASSGTLSNQAVNVIDAAKKATTDKADADTKAKVAAEANSRAQADLVRQFEKFNNTVPRSTSLLSDFVNQYRYLLGAMGIQQLVSSIITIGGEIEQQHIALRNIIGDIAEADSLFSDIKNLALESPFTFGQLNRDVKQLMAYGVETQDIYETTKKLGDISAGLGVSFERIALAYGQTKAREWLDAKELRQFAYAGIPLQKLLADLYSERTGGAVSTKDVQKMIKQREVSFADVQEVLFGMTEEGGKFENMQAVLSDTLLGKWNKLKDAWEIMMADFARGDSLVGGTFKTMIEGVTQLVLGFHKLLPYIATFFGMFTLRKMGGFLATSGLSGKLLSSKQELANTLRQKAFTQELSAVEKQILATKTQITSRDIKNLATSKAITAQEQQRLIAQRKMLTSANLFSHSWKKIMGSFTLPFNHAQNQSGWAGLMKGAGGFMGGLGSMAWNGVKGLGSSMFSMMGGIPGLALTGATMLGMKLYQDHQETVESYKKNEEAIRTRYENLQKFLEDNPLRMTFETSGQEDAEYQKLKEQYREILGEEFIPDMSWGVSRYQQLYAELELLKESLEVAKNFGEVMTRINNASNGELDESMVENANDFIEALHKYNLVDGTRDPSVKSAAEEVMHNQWDTFVGDAFRAFEQLSSLTEKYGDKAQYVAKVVVREYVKSQEELSNEAKQLLIDYMDFMYEKTHNGSEGILNYISAKLIEDDKELIKDIEDGLLDGKSAEEIGNELGSRIQGAASDAIKKRLPEEYNALRDYIWSQPLIVRVIMDAQGAESSYSKLYKTVIGNLDKNLDKNIRDKAKKRLETATKENSYEEAANSLNRELDDIKKELKRARKADDTETVKELEETETALEAAIRSGNGAFDAEQKGSTRQTDIQLKLLNKEANAVKKFIKLYKKYRDEFGAVEAGARIKKESEGLGLDEYDLTDDEKAYAKLVEKYTELAKKGTEERKDALISITADAQGNTFENEKKYISARIKMYKESLDEIEKMYERRDKFRERYGDLFGQEKGLFQNISDPYYGITFGKINAADLEAGLGLETVDIVKYAEKYSKHLERLILEEAKKRTGKNFSIGEIVGINEDDMKEKFGDSVIADLVSRYKKELEKERTNYFDTIYSQWDKLKSSADEATKAAAAYAEVERRINALALKTYDSNGKLTFSYNEAEQKALNIAALERDTAIQKVSQDYIDFMNHSDILSKEQARSMGESIKENITARWKEGLISLEDYQKELEQVTKVLDAINGRDILSSIGNNFKYGSRRLELYSDLKNQGISQYTFDKKSAAYYGYSEGDTVSLATLLGDGKQNLTGFNKSLKDLGNAFEGVKNVVTPVISLFEALGDDMEGVTTILGIGGNAINAGLSVSSGLSQIGGLFGDGTSGISKFLGDAGPYAAAAGAALSVITSIVQLHDKSIQKEIDASKRRQKEAQNLFNNLKSTFERTLGGAYADSSYVQDSLNALKAQREEQAKQIELEQSKKKKDDDALADYKQAYKEIDEQIKYYLVDLAKELYGIDVKGWASELASAIVDAWSQGKDAARAYEDTVKDIMKKVYTTVLQQKFLEKALADVDVNGIIKRAMENDDQLDDREAKELADATKRAGEMVVGNMTAALDAAEAAGIIQKDIATTNGTLSTNIQNITEPTAQLLESYINSIRAYVAQDNLMFTTFFTNTLPEMSEIQRSQLVQLDAIASFTERNALAAERMESIFNAVTNGTKRLYVQ